MKIKFSNGIVLRRRGIMPPPTKRFIDRKKEAKKKACRGRGMRQSIRDRMKG